MQDAPKFLKSLTIDHARDGEVMIAFRHERRAASIVERISAATRRARLVRGLLDQMLNDIEVLDQPDTNYWTATGYRVPDTPHYTVKPGETGFKMVPVTRNVPRSFITNMRDGDSVPAGAPASARGIAFGGDCGVARVDLSIDGGQSWQPTKLDADQGTYGFRQWQTQFTLPARGARTPDGSLHQHRNEAQPDFKIWNQPATCTTLLKRPMWSAPEEEPGMLRAVLPMAAVLGLVLLLHPVRPQRSPH